jgi:hypothetical protein
VTRGAVQSSDPVVPDRDEPCQPRSRARYRKGRKNVNKIQVMCPPDGPALTPDQRQATLQAVARCLQAGAWGVAIEAIRRARSQPLRASQQDLGRFRDGPPVPFEDSCVILRTIALWLERHSLVGAVRALESQLEFAREGVSDWGAVASEMGAGARHVDQCRHKGTRA